MRLIGRCTNSEDAERFSAYLGKRGIENRLEPQFESQGEIAYQIWVLEEDRLQEAAQEFIEFQKTPEDPKFRVSGKADVFEPNKTNEPLLIQKNREIIGRKSAPFTALIIFICAFLYLLNSIQEYTLAKQKIQDVTQIENLLLFETPPSSIEDRSMNSYFYGYYSILLAKFKGIDPSLLKGPSFTQILAGQVWRLFTPCLLHGGLFHILFNMLWVWLLSRPIEWRLGIFRLLGFTLIVGIISNIAQYLVSGPMFLGYSGVIMGFAGFIWMRQKKAPWEGYPIRPATFRFLFIFVGGLALISFFNFFLQAFTAVRLPLNIANTAHLVGGFVGALLGCSKYFARRAVR